MPTRSRDAVIVPFAVRVVRDNRFKHATDDEPILSNFDGSGSDLISDFGAFLNGLPKKELVHRDDDRFGIVQELEKKKRTIECSMNGGRSGLERTLKLHATAEELKLERTGSQWSDFRIFIVIPKNSLTGWVLVEKDGVDTVPGSWRSEFATHFRDRHPGFKVVFSNVRTASLWREVENAIDDPRVLWVEVAKRDDSDDLSPNTRGAVRGVTRSTTEVYQPVGGRSGGAMLRAIRRKFTKLKNDNGLVEIDLYDDQDDLADEDLKIDLVDDVLEITARVLDEDGRPKTVRFSGAREPIETYVVDGVQAGTLTAAQMRVEAYRHVRSLATNASVELGADWNSGEWDTDLDTDAMEVMAHEPEANPQAGQ
ncbi:MAG: hypothetical protein ACI39C_07220 [Dietzia sp.]